jgi:hypothetical protein
MRVARLVAGPRESLDRGGGQHRPVGAVSRGETGDKVREAGREVSRIRG